MDIVAERLASFYLGLKHDLAKGETLEETVHYDARDLTTHAVCLGMTGSGKTGLGVILLEEAALDGVPSLVIDPKGDMTNLLLAFPDLRPEDFLPWVNPDDARRKNQTVEDFAARTADLWRNGLAGTGQDPERIRRLKASAGFTIYTPGSSAGRQVSILHTLRAPTLSWENESELIRDKIESVVSALLTLVGIEADPVRSREHILLANIFEKAWHAGEDLDLAQLIMRIQKPPFSQLGVFPVDSFFPEKDRLQLAMLLNGLIAAPTFADWIQGQPLDVDGLLYGPDGKPQVSILYIAHLSEQERQFFVTLLLEQVVSWMHAQSGTTSLRALIYMDEMFGYLPPHPANPPTKKPLLTLLKQARAFGLGLILATQNPVDLDYKALANTGTWFVGRMQTDRDKQRLLDGLEGAEASGGGLGRSDFDRMISALQSRVFLLHNVHEGEPLVFSTRWAMSYLRGPLTRTQVRELAADQLPAPAGSPPTEGITAAPHRPAAAAPQPVPPPATLSYGKIPPQLPSAVKQVFVPAQISLAAALRGLASDRGWSIQSQQDLRGSLIYEPALVGLARLHFVHTKSRQAHEEDVAYLRRFEGTGGWPDARVQLDLRDLERNAEPDAYYADLPSELGAARSLSSFEKEFADYLYYNSAISLLYNPHLGLYSEVGEDGKAFQRRCREAAKVARDEEVQKLKAKYESQFKRLDDQLDREERELDEDKVEFDARKQEELLSGAESVFGFFTGRRSSSKISAASRRRRMTRQAKADVQESERTIKKLEEEIEALEDKAKAEVEEITEKWNRLIDEVEKEEVRPRRSDVQVSLVALAWLPRWEVVVAGQSLAMPAYEITRT
jgi:hypothetical protein